MVSVRLLCGNNASEVSVGTHVGTLINTRSEGRKEVTFGDMSSSSNRLGRTEQLDRTLDVVIISDDDDEPPKRAPVPAKRAREPVRHPAPPAPPSRRPVATQFHRSARCATMHPSTRPVRCRRSSASHRWRSSLNSQSKRNSGKVVVVVVELVVTGISHIGGVAAVVAPAVAVAEAAAAARPALAIHSRKATSGTSCFDMSSVGVKPSSRALVRRPPRIQERRELPGAATAVAAAAFAPSAANWLRWCDSQPLLSIKTISSRSY